MLTVSDRASAGTRTDESGPALAARLDAAGFAVTQRVCPDERGAIAEAIRDAVASGHALIVATGGTGVAPTDVTPQALAGLLDYEVPGFGELMRAEGRRSTPFSTLSRSLGGVIGRTFVLAVPGNPRGAVESFDAVADLLDHVVELLAGTPGHHDHGSEESGPP